MLANWTPIQEAKINAGKRYLETTTDTDSLYVLVVMIGPTVFGKMIFSNSDTIWSRVEKPDQFRLSEILQCSAVFGTPVSRFIEILLRQKEHNKMAISKGEPVGRNKYTAGY